MGNTPAVSNILFLEIHEKSFHIRNQEYVIKNWHQFTYAALCEFSTGEMTCNMAKAASNASRTLVGQNNGYNDEYSCSKEAVKRVNMTSALNYGNAYASFLSTTCTSFIEYEANSCIIKLGGNNRACFGPGI